jgi:hypothetical protein
MFHNLFEIVKSEIAPASHILLAIIGKGSSMVGSIHDFKEDFN